MLSCLPFFTNRSAKKESFPLLKLPLLAFERVVYFQEPIERITLSLCSKKTKQSIRKLRIKVPEIRIMLYPIDVAIYSNGSNLVRLVTDKGYQRTRETIEQQRTLGIPTERPKLKILCRDRDEDGSRLTIWRIKNDVNTFMVESDSGMSHRERTLFMARLLFDLFIPAVVHWSVSAACSPDEQLAELCQLVQSPRFSAPRVRLQTRINNKHPSKLQVVIDNIGPVDEFLVTDSVRNPCELKNAFNFKNVMFQDATWVTLQNLPNELNICESLKFKKTQFTNEDVNEFLKVWMQNGIGKLRRFEFYLRRRQPTERIIFKGIPVLKVVKGGNRDKWFIATRADTGSGLDLASVHIEPYSKGGKNQRRVLFSTYTDRQHANERKIVRMLHERASFEQKMKSTETRIDEVYDGILTSPTDRERLREKLADIQKEMDRLRESLKENSTELRRQSVQFNDGVEVLRE